MVVVDRIVRRKPLILERVIRKSVTTNFNKNKKVVDESHPPGGNELSLYGGSDLDEPIDQLVDTTKSLKVNFTSNSDHFRPEENEEGHFSAVDQFHQQEKIWLA